MTLNCGQIFAWILYFCELMHVHVVREGTTGLSHCVIAIMKYVDHNLNKQPSWWSYILLQASVIHSTTQWNIAVDICVNIANMLNKLTILFSTSIVCKVVAVIEGSTRCDWAEKNII